MPAHIYTQGFQASRFELDALVLQPSAQQNKFRIYDTYRVFHQETSIFWQVVVAVIVREKFI